MFAVVCNPKNLFNITLWRQSSYYKALSKKKPIPYGCQSHSFLHSTGNFLCSPVTKEPPHPFNEYLLKVQSIKRITGRRIFRTGVVGIGNRIHHSLILTWVLVYTYMVGQPKGPSRIIYNTLTKPFGNAQFALTGKLWHYTLGKM